MNHPTNPATPQPRCPDWCIVTPEAHAHDLARGGHVVLDHCSRDYGAVYLTAEQPHRGPLGPAAAMLGDELAGRPLSSDDLRALARDALVAADELDRLP